jgi:nucleoside-diphosphate-sugar epimerase
LVADGHRVVASDLGTAAQRKTAAALPAGAEARWADLTDPGQVDRLLAETSPTAIVHLAAVIPPLIYRQPTLGRRVNVDATVTLLRAAQSRPHPVRFIQASSNAVYGARNPHRHRELLRPDSPMNPADLYGAHKAEAEQHLRASDLEWVILRLAGVISVEPAAMPFSVDALFFESALPTDGRIHTVDVRDVARAFAAAVSSTSCPAACRAIRTATTTGSSRTGWIRLGPSTSCNSSAIRGRTCSPRCGRPPGGGAARCG